MSIFLSTMGQVLANKFQFFIYFNRLHDVGIGGAPQGGPHDTDSAGREATGSTGVLMATESQVVYKGWGVEKSLNIIKIKFLTSLLTNN